MNPICRLLGLLSLFLTADASAQNNHVTALEWKMAGEIPAPFGSDQPLGLAGPVAGIYDSVLIVGGGSNFPDGMPWMGGEKKYYDDIYIFTRSANDSFLVKRALKLSRPLAYAASVSTPKGIVVAGGENEYGPVNKVLLMEWLPEREGINIRQLPDLPVELTNASIALAGHTLYLAGGETPDSVSGLFISLDMNDTRGGWRELPALPRPVSHAVMLVQSNGKNNCIYLIGGRKKNAAGISDLYANTSCFDLNTNRWSEKQALPYALSAGTGVAVNSQELLLLGGDAGASFHKTEVLLQAIAKEKDSVRKEVLINEKAKVQSTHPGFSNKVLLYNTVKNEWKQLGEIPFPSPVTTTAIKWDNQIIIPGGEIKAGVRTPYILEAKIISN